MSVGKMVEILEELTAHETRGDLETFTHLYGENAVKQLNLGNISEFSFWDNGQTVLIYDGRSVVFDCNYEICYGLKRLTTCYDKNGLFFEFKNY